MTLLALNPTNIPFDASAQYSIDNGPRISFTVPGQNSTVQQYNLVSFQTGLLSPGSHHLFVQYAFDNLVLEQGSAPLVLDYFIIQNQTSPSRPLSQGGIAGVVIGSLVGLALIVFGLIRFIKGKKAAASLVREYKPDEAYYGEGPGLEGEKMTLAIL